MTLYLRLSSWLNHGNLELLTTRPVAIVAGVNASGKTALLDGLEFAFLGTGKLRGVATKKDLALLSISDEATAARVDVGIPDAGLDFAREMDRSGDQSVTIDETVYKVTRGDAKLWSALGLDPAQIRAALEANDMLRGDEAERRRVLFATAKAHHTTTSVAIGLGDAGLSAEDVRRLARQSIEDGFLAAQKTAETERAGRSRRLREELVREPDPAYRAEWAEREIRLDEIAIDELLAREKELEAKLADAERAVGASRATLVARRDQEQERHRELSSEGTDLSRREEELEEPPDRAETACADLERISAERVRVREGLAAKRQALQVSEGQAVDKPEFCPVIAGAPRCPMSKPKLAAHRKAVEGDRDSIRAEIERRESELSQLDERFEAARRLVEDASRRAREKESVSGRMARVHAQLDELESRMSETEEALDKAADETGADQQAEDLRQRLANLRELTNQKRRYETQRAAAQSDAATRERLEAERAAWDRAAKLLAPGGIPLQLFTAKIPELQKHLDEFGIAPIRLTPYAELEAEVDGRWRRRAQLSESWRLRLSMAASHLVARAAGFPVLVLDKFDHLDRPGRRDVLEGARRVAPAYPGGVLILATLQREAPVPVGLADVETFWLHDGGISRVG